MALGTGGGGAIAPSIFRQTKNKGLKNSNRLSVCSNRFISKWILVITDILIHKIVLFCYVRVADFKGLWHILIKIFFSNCNYTHCNYTHCLVYIIIYIFNKNEKNRPIHGYFKYRSGDIHLGKKSQSWVPPLKLP